MDLRLALMCGTDIPVPECQLIIHQPKIKEIALIGEKDFFIGYQTLLVNRNMIEQGENVPLNITNFQIFMTIMKEKETADKKEAVLQLFQLIFPDCKATFLPASIIISGKGNTATIDDNNFEFFQEAIKSVFCFSSGRQDQTTFNPANEQARQIAEKLMRGRARVAAQNGQANASIFSQYLSVITVGIGSMSLKDAMDLTMYQMFDLVERYALYVDWDIDIRARLAGATPDGKPENWMKNIH
jgi:hypothetical protein